MESTTSATAPAFPADQIRAGVHAMWASVSGNWGEHADYVDEQAAALTESLLDRAALAPGQRVLELACGAGGVGLAAAPLVAPGEVVLSDVAEPMTAIAAARAAARGVTNVSTAVLDIEEIAQPDAAFDAVLCREGLMFAVDHGRAAREIARVLKPGGRAAIAVWGPRARNPWLGVVFDVVSAQMGAPVPPPGIPGPFALEDAGALERVLVDAGFEEVAVGDVALVRKAPSFEEWWARTTALAGPLANVIAHLPAEVTGAIEERAREAVRAYETGGGLEFPSLSLVAGGRRPA